MLRDKESPLVEVINEDVAAASLLSFHGGNDEESEQRDMCENIAFEAVFPATRIGVISSAHDIIFLWIRF